MAIGDSITDPIPPVGTSGTGYASQLVAFLTEVKARLEAKVALTSLLAGLFDLSNNPIANASYVSLYNRASAPTTPIGSFQNYGNDVYWVGASGAVRITNGATLDAVSLRGITGNYVAPAEFYYDLGSVTYQAFSDTGTTPDTWAYVAARGFDIYGTATSTTRVRVAWAGGGSYTLTIPAAVPATTKFLRMDTTGAVLTTGTVDEDITLDANRSVTLSGTGKYKRGTKVYSTPAIAPAVNVESGAGVGTTAGLPGSVQSASTVAYYPLYGLPVDVTIDKITVNATAAIPATVSLQLHRADNFGPVFTSVGGAVAGSGGVQTDIVIGAAALAAPYWVKVTTGVAGVTITHFDVWTSIS